MSWLILIIYTFAVYGIGILFTQMIGPFAIFFRLRLWANKISTNLGYMLKCMTCFPTNVGWVMSLVNWFLVPQVAITPFNMILRGTNYWWLAMILDAAYCAGTCHIISNIDDFIDKSTPIYEDEQNQ